MLLGRLVDTVQHDNNAGVSGEAMFLSVAYFLAWIGMLLGEKWNTLGVYFHRFDAVIVGVGVIGAIWWVRRHMRHGKLVVEA